MPERVPAWVSGINDFEARLATAAGYSSPSQQNDDVAPLRVQNGIRDSGGFPGQVTLGTNKVTVNAFQALIQDPARPGQGAYLVTLDAAKDLTLTGADPALDRMDLVIAEIDSTVSNSFTVRVVPGTPSASAVAPTVTNPLHLKLARITVPRNSTTFTVLDLRQFTVALGGILPVRDGTLLPEASGASSRFIFNLQNRQLLVSSGGQWSTYRPPRGSVDTWHAPGFAASWRNFSQGGGMAPIGYTITEDGWVRLRGRVETTIVRTVTAGIFWLPDPYRPKYRHVFTQWSSNGPWRVDVMTDGGVTVEASATVSLPVNGWVQLDNIAFSARDHTRDA